MIKYKEGDTWKDAVLDYYPVGALYFSFSDISPATLFGGSWSKLTSQGRLIGVAGTNSAQQYVPAGNFGGHNNIIINNLPPHSHSFLYKDNSGSKSGVGFYSSHFEPNNDYHFWGYNNAYAMQGYFDEHIYANTGGAYFAAGGFLSLLLRYLYLGESGVSLKEVSRND